MRLKIVDQLDLLDRSIQLAQGAVVVPSDRDAKDKEPCSLPVNYHKIQKLFAEDVISIWRYS